MNIRLIADNGEVVTTTALAPKVSSAGSRGFFSAFKAEVDGKRYQVSVGAWEIGSKPRLDANGVDTAVKTTKTTRPVKR